MPAPEPIHKYKGQILKSARPATPDDKGYDPGRGRQMLIAKQDGTESVVAQNDVISEPGQPEAPEAAPQEQTS